ncbi:PTS system mannose/fructose/N-acetylgalactosamine-transporter subunit IIB [Staphylococcus pettenkoferi]|uniref:PTS system mannose/fructose/N-acetylgalactosamine-transporter subunit IIB n=1 Tax=Staphylococcus pettenkoferi TaxID=170573 RepID=UPI001F572C80|nr:PTS sugar transporter subunit IIB [Staphylococcus pettenkoferi]MCI2802812.1 PTS sugar transporter subunit IIB [Staphylococcus pettenkoferi]
MAIIASRIDGRLIHGQVANLWGMKLGITRFMVIDDEVAQNDVEKQSLKLATPAGIRLSVLSVEKAATNIKNGKYDSQRLMIVARKPDRFLRLLDYGVDFGTLNVGNMSQSDDTRSITNSINVTDEDVRVFEALNSKGVEIVSQMVPNNKAEAFMPLLKK